MKESICRIIKLLYKDFKEIKIALPLLSIIFIIAGIISIYVDFGVFIIIGGCVMPSIILFYSDFSSENLATHNLLLPANNHEKIISRMITSLIISPIYIFILYIISGLIVHFISTLTGGTYFMEQFLFEGLSLNMLLLVFLLQIISTVIFLRFGEKMLNVIVGIVFPTIFIGMVFDTIFKSIFPAVAALLSYEKMMNGAFYQEFTNIISIITLFFIIYFWITAYYCLQEKELNQVKSKYPF